MTQREVSIRTTGNRSTPPCAICGNTLPLLSGEDVARLLNVDLDTIRLWLAEGRLHGPPGPALEPQICPGSFPGS